LAEDPGCCTSEHVESACTLGVLVVIALLVVAPYLVWSG
jgi:hypothetical protein